MAWSCIRIYDQAHVLVKSMYKASVNLVRQFTSKFPWAKQGLTLNTETKPTTEIIFVQVWWKAVPKGEKSTMSAITVTKHFINI